MQTLYFEPARDKTIALADREKITKHFHSIPLDQGNRLSFIWEALNHKKGTINHRTHSQC